MFAPFLAVYGFGASASVFAFLVFLCRASRWRILKPGEEFLVIVGLVIFWPLILIGLLSFIASRRAARA